jgi:RNA polymerase sigma factor (sigma-70 family)
MTMALQGTRLLGRIRRVVAAQSPSRQSDVQLVQQFIRERDETAFATLVARHGSMVLGVCRNVLHHQQDAEDVFQAVFLVLARKPQSIRKQQALSSWLHGVAYRLALKARARRSRREVCDRQDRERMTPDVGSASTVDDLTVRELSAILHAELERLPDTYRTPLLLCYWEGKTRDEAAERIGITPGKFKKRLERARRVLSSRLARRGLAPSLASLALWFSDSAASATVSHSLIQSTTQAALAFAVGEPAAAASAAALALAQGAIRIMTLTKIATVLVLVLCLGGLSTILGLSGYQDLHARHQDPVGRLTAVEPQAQGKDREPAGKKTDQERIVGTWRIASILSDGKPVEPEFSGLTRLTFTKDGKAIMNVAKQISEGTYKLVVAGKIDVSFNPREKPGPGIYKFDGDNRLTLCASSGGGERPTDFAAEKGSSRVQFNLTRAKAGEESPTDDEIAKLAQPAARVQEAVARQISANHLKQIGLAIHNYADTNKALPAQAIYDKEGKKALLSWRVALLPYVEQNALYQEFKLDEPWDSANNKKLIGKMPQTFELDFGPKRVGYTYYQALTGPGTAFDGSKASKFDDFARGLSNIMLVAEAKQPVIWTKPEDLIMPKDKEKLPPIGNLFKNGFHVLMADGSVRMVPHSVEPKILHEAASLKDEEKKP